MEDKERTYSNEQGLPIKIFWESPNLKQTILYKYDNSGNLIEEKITQIDKNTNNVSVMLCEYDNESQRIVFMGDGVVDIQEFLHN
jgi:hypothetical protein